MKKWKKLVKWKDVGKQRNQRSLRNLRASLPALVMVLWAAVSLSACGSKTAGTAAVMETAAAPKAAAAVSGYAENAAMDQAMEISMEEGSGNMLAETAAGQSAVSDTGALASSGRKLIRDVSMNVEAKDFDSVLSQITDRVSELEGYVESSDVSGISVDAYYGNQQRYADIKARIPADRLDRFIETVENAGNVTSRQGKVTDVTLQYADTESRKKSLEIEQERLWALLEKAESLDAVVALESRLSEIRYQLESLTSQLRLYDNQVDYSTVSIYVVEVKDLTPTAPDSIGTRIQKGFNRSLSSLEETAAGLIVWFAASSPILFVLAMLVGAVVLIARKVGRRIKAGKRFRGCSSDPHNDCAEESERKNNAERKINQEKDPRA